MIYPPSEKGISYASGRRSNLCLRDGHVAERQTSTEKCVVCLEDSRKRNGVKFGPKFKLTKHQRDEAIARREKGESLTSIGKSYNVSYMTISRL